MTEPAVPTMLDAAALAHRMQQPGEWALLDVQEPGRFVEGHIFHACSVPYGRLELRVPDLVPRKNTPIILTDAADEGTARAAARRLAGQGYVAVSVLEGGNRAWAASGQTLFQGVRVPSKAFGEHVEETRKTPSIDADTLAAMAEGAQRFLLLDGRPEHEHTLYTLPGSRCCPNGELAARIESLASDPAQTIVVHCAGRTRSIIGAQTLRELGLPNPVVALRNGTQGWLLSGRELVRHVQPQPLPPLTDAQRQRNRERGRQRMEHQGTPRVGMEELRRLQADARRTVYLLDVRSAAEFATATVVGARHAPGGQLVQATDLWVGVQGARVVVFDDDVLRAVVVAHWLRDMGIDAAVLDDPVLTPGAASDGPADADPGPALPRIRSAELAGWRLLDLRSSASHRHGHHPGALWTVRSRIPTQVHAGDRVAFVSDDPRLAALAALDALDAGAAATALLDDPRSDVCTPDSPPDRERVDHEFFTAGRNDGNREAAMQYLRWETHLLQQMGPCEWHRFRAPATAGTQAGPPP